MKKKQKQNALSNLLIDLIKSEDSNVYWWI